MKSWVLFLASLSLTGVSVHADSGAMPGAPNVRFLNCIANAHPLEGVEYILEVTTQAVNPKYNVRKVRVLSRANFPDAETNITELTEMSQDISSGTFAAGDTHADLGKAPLAAVLKMDNVNFNCAD